MQNLQEKRNIFIIFYMLYYLQIQFVNQILKYGLVSLIPIMVCCAVIAIIFLEIYWVYGKSMRTGLLMLCAGLASSFIIAFSPTVYASGLVGGDAILMDSCPMRCITQIRDNNY